jgi:hypothetical protein
LSRSTFPFSDAHRRSAMNPAGAERRVELAVGAGAPRPADGGAAGTRRKDDAIGERVPGLAKRASVNTCSPDRDGAA